MVAPSTLPNYREFHGNQGTIDQIEQHQCDVVICVTPAVAQKLALKRIAINVDDARIPDNRGQQPIDVPVAEGGPAAYFSTLPIKAIVHHLRQCGIPAHVSNTAGTMCATMFSMGSCTMLRSIRNSIALGLSISPIYHSKPLRMQTP